MTGLTSRRVVGDIESGLRMGLPAAWARAIELKPGDRLEVLYGDVLLAIPRPSPQAARVRLAMAEVE